MANLGHFDASTVAPAQAYSPLPAGKYLAMITESEMKATKAGTGEYLQLTIEVQDGEFKGRKVFDRLNLKNANVTAVEIAQRQLSALCHATGVMQLQDSEQLHFKPVIVKVSVQHDAGQEPSNVVKGYEAPTGTMGQQSAYVPPVRQASAPAHMAPPAAAPARAAAPWAK